MKEASSDPAAGTISVFAAGSLRNVLPALVGEFAAPAGVSVEVRHGPAGLLRERIEAGARPDLFLSADTAHPARLAELDLSLPPVLFARNRIAAAVREDAGITQANFVERLLSPDVAIATSTPVKDPSGDYAWAIFRRIDAARPGAFAILDAKARKLVGATEPGQQPGSYDAVAEALRDGSATLFLGYVTGLASLVEKVEGVALVDIPEAVNVTPEYGMAALNGCKPAARAFALSILSAKGQRVLRSFGFQPVSLPDAS